VPVPAPDDATDAAPSDATAGSPDGPPEATAPDSDSRSDPVTPAASPDDATADTDDSYGPTEGPSGREVVVPARLYKTVTVMSTLTAMASVVGGFVALDAATDRASAAVGEVDAPLALLGLGLIVGGAAVYAFGTRFQAGDPADGDETEETDPDTNTGD